MSPFDIAIIVFFSVAFVGVAGYLIWRKAHGKSGCGCGCSGCSSACNCGKKDNGKQSEK